MNLSALIQKIWQNFLSLIRDAPSSPPTLLFKRVEEAGDWRSGTGLWSGTLPLFSTRVYYLEVSRVSYADKRELGIKPSPTHTFKVYYFVSSQSAPQTQGQKQRIMVFVAYQNCYLQGSAEDLIAVEVIGKAIHRRLERLCEVGFSTSTSDPIKAEIITRLGELPQVRLDKDSKALPAVTLLGRATEKTSEDWQRFVDREMQKERDKRTERIKNRSL